MIDIMGGKNPIRIAALLLLVIAFAVPLNGAAPGNKVSAELDSPQTAVGEEITYTVTVEGEGIPENLRPDVPGIKTDGIDLLGVNSSRSMTSGSSIHIEINGKVVRDENSGSQIVNFEYHLRAAKPGNFKIGPAVVQIGGATYSSNAVTLNVTSLPSPGKNVTPTGEVFVQAEQSAQRLWLGQLLTVSYYFYAREDADIKEITETQPPELNGFIKQDFQQSKTTPSREDLNGYRYVRVFIGRLLAFPTRSGKLTIGPLNQYYTKVIMLGRHSIFPQYQLGNAKASSQPVTVEVMPLPENGKPSDFSGSVGRFSIDASLDRTNIRAGENVTMTVKITGTGNLGGAADPRLNMPSTVESYPPEKADNSVMEGNELKWERTYRYILTPHSGKTAIGPVSLSYFDPEKGAYINATSQAFEVNASPGSEMSSMSSGNQDKEQKLGNDIRYIQLDTTNLQENDPFLFRRTWYVSIHLLPLLFLGAAVLWRKRRDRLETDIPFARRQKSYRRALERVEKARKTTASEDAFHRELYMAISGYMADHFNLPDVGLPPGEFVPHLKNTGVSEENINQAIQFLEKCQAVRYLPGNSNSDEKDLLKEAGEILNLLRRTLKESPNR